MSDEIPPTGTLTGKARAAHLREVQVEIERVLRGARTKWVHHLSVAEVKALMVRAVENVTQKDAELVQINGGPPVNLGDALAAAEARAEAAEARVALLTAHNADVAAEAAGWAKLALIKETDAAALRAKLEAVRAALQSVLAACDQGRMVPRGGICGQTIEACLRASVYNGVPVWPIEEARTALALLDAPKTEPAP